MEHNRLESEKISRLLNASEGITLAAAVLFTMGVTTIVMIWPEPFIRIFNADQELIRMGKGMLRIYGREFIILIPLIYMLPVLLPWGVMAVVLAEPAADLITTGTNALYFRCFIRKKLQERQRRPGSIAYGFGMVCTDVLICSGNVCRLEWKRLKIRKLKIRKEKNDVCNNRRHRFMRGDSSTPRLPVRCFLCGARRL